ncbi:MAG: M28 family peptidase [Candidatus Aminicenantes bacterium]|nr:M28 family peptidase [Candidatus Aminicenantes bacterium]NIT21986.1 M28 family peptidase [Candidatus Aminicenantes bacterium]
MTEIIIVLLLALLIFLIYSTIKVRFSSFVDPGKPAFANDSETEPEVKHLYNHVHYLTEQIGSRSVYEYEKINAAKNYLETVLKDLGFDYTLQNYQYQGNTFSNIIVTIPGQKAPEKIFIIGAHYDTVFNTPGADDNASAVAVLLELCRLLMGYQPAKTLKLIFFVLEEPPAFQSKYMGSYVYAKTAKAKKEDIFGMISLEMLGYYHDTKGAQTFPLPLMGFFYSNVPNFIGVVGNLKSRRLVKQVADSIKKGSSILVEYLAAVRLVPGIDLSDHAPFWRMGYPAVMITDTAFYRNPNYHTVTDTIDTLDFKKMAELLKGIVQVVKDQTST